MAKFVLNVRLERSHRKAAKTVLNVVLTTLMLMLVLQVAPRVSSAFSHLAVHQIHMTRVLSVRRVTAVMARLNKHYVWLAPFLLEPVVNVLCVVEIICIQQRMGPQAAYSAKLVATQVKITPPAQNALLAIIAMVAILRFLIVHVSTVLLLRETHVLMLALTSAARVIQGIRCTT